MYVLTIEGCEPIRCADGYTVLGQLDLMFAICEREGVTMPTFTVKFVR